ncbi:NAD(P)-dependent dehydrogenase (short-subunit alcohol dehydrogenase family) [Sphingomonas sp. PP-F2F-G114-C0414]|uniref:SDR family NAD(P)-dependent oxidoreductase n=1 Tax=unclassified Sphingomonas TaxID=196159 RepID=UPI000EF8F4CC|nr:MULTISPECIES: SDR family oxidoreductase [unclassified Sphingomonas]RMB37288.1 NAD(P)-dependent dehydrogenase (short-subunit alcohol dehydrogenase family) [Sphingomonas sp. PP-F2F-G114-C0414]RZM35099.1 MAG: SDR family oxidoreductase [Sphingomonas sp.]TCP71572.1 NAD(P)-dependent dehydrogenase (short-subunit alcohol dehydrogenase family) [Sphingomonas sp. PP-CE-1G-424]
MRFTDKSIIVTGAGSGIGRAAALLFASEGGRVVVADKTEGADETAHLITQAGGTAKAIRIDAGLEEDVIRTIALACDSFGGLDVMFANAGISGGMANLFDTDVALITEVLRVNLIGPFLAIKHAAPRIAERGKGAIVLTASVAGIRSGAGSPAYSASKAGVINLAAVSAQQLTGSNVRVNAICPGLTETGMTKPVFDYAREANKMDRVGRLNPLHRGAQPEELAKVALFLASDDASYVNGQAIAVDGGLSSSHPVTRQEYGKTAA